jgi:hypothetical protein
MWSRKEKSIARQTFDKASKRELDSLMHEVKKRANSIKAPEVIWLLNDFLREQRKEIDDKYDYRYSQLIFVFGRLLSEGWLDIDELEGLDDDKMTKIKYVAESLKSKM